MALKIFLLVTFVASTVHGLPTDEKLTRSSLQDYKESIGMYDGSLTTIQKHPYMVALITSNYDIGFYCAGNIVTNSWVITTAFCLQSQVPSSVTVIAGTNDPTAAGGSEYPVTTLVQHPKYGSATGWEDYNYGCVKVSGKFRWSTKIKPTRLPNAEVSVNTNMMVAGWGATTYDDDDPTHPLRQGWMRWYDVEICATEYKVWLGLNWTNRMACAYNRGKTTLCREDFGAGLVHGGVLYGMFAGTGDMFCSQYSSPALLADVKTGVPWLRKITGAK
uniref:Peptidase S1 domain-containing protein n=1 Tax=Graphocephala atropunctata TaxID=36148 RepID=A0A1B6LWR7_9HEMI